MVIRDAVLYQKEQEKEVEQQISVAALVVWPLVVVVETCEEEGVVNWIRGEEEQTEGAKKLIVVLVVVVDQE